MFIGRSIKTAVPEGTIIGAGAGNYISPYVPTYGQMEYIPCGCK